MAVAETISEPNSIQETLRTISKNPITHSLWLNTLSLLEHLGSRKILMTQSSEDTSEMILRHATEEARHALFFKKAARTIRPEFSKGYQPSDLLKGTAAKLYFAKLDASVRKELHSAFPKNHPKLSYLAYLYTTTIIEKRAMVVYNDYNSVLESERSPVNLRNLILEEEGHLEEMGSELTKWDPSWEVRLGRLEETESILFRRFWKQIKEFTVESAVF
ncbi:rubrerythrin [Leptospira sp. 96542]|nr:rubrerythrin [Leptospira sp. 96542]